MANIAHMNPTAPVEGFRWESGTASPGIAAIRGTASDQAKTAGAKATALLGIVDLDQAPAAGDIVSLRLWAAGTICYVQAGGAVAVDAFLTTNASGQFVTGATSDKALAKAFGPAAGAGELIPAILLDGDKTL